MEITNQTPNFSIVAPGPCQAKCEFCFWEKQKTAKNYLQRLAFVLDTLPACFNQVSVTGGEPTLSPFLNDILEMLEERKERFPKVVMSTNAWKLAEHKDHVNRTVTHLNISRHSLSDDINQQIFKTKNVHHLEDLRELITTNITIPVTLNAVVKPDVSHSFFQSYINYCHGMGVDACFRVEHGSLDAINLEERLNNMFIEKVGESECPVCRSAYYDLGGTQFALKYSVLEPTKAVDGIYELVLHPNGDLTADWDGNIVVDLKEAQA